MAPRRRFAAALHFGGALLWLGLASGRLAAQSDPDSYQRAISSALERYQAGAWSEAAALFEHAYALDPSARALRGAALSAYYQGDFATAATTFQRALREDHTPLSTEQREQAQALLLRAYEHVAQVRLTTRPEQVDVRVDGVAVQLEGPILLATGHYRIELSCSGCEPMVREIDVAAGQQLDLHVELALVGASEPAANVIRSAPAATAEIAKARLQNRPQQAPPAAETRPAALAEPPAAVQVAKAPAVRRVHFDTTPAGALIWIDGARACAAPCELELQERALAVQATLRGHVPALRSLVAPFPARVALALIPASTGRRREATQSEPDDLPPLLPR